jgi:hypothetical protein
MSTNKASRRSKRSNTTEDDAGANLVTPDYDETTKRLKTRIQVEKRVALRSVNFCTELLPDGDLPFPLPFHSFSDHSRFSVSNARMP